jgi:tricorn protease
MLSTGLNEFAKHFYPQLRKQALIVDVRGNGGGNVSPQLIERLRREMAMVAIARNTEPFPEPSGTFVGPMACLLNEFSASDGDIFPYRFRHYKLGPLIGKRSWGGVVGIRGPLPLLDGGDLRKPEFSRYDVAGKQWVMENVGVEPDIVVDNDPAREYAGEDQQLDKAVEVLLTELRKKDRTIPAPPPYPKR